MVHTRHSYNKDIEIIPQINGHTEDSLGVEEEKAVGGQEEEEKSHNDPSENHVEDHDPRYELPLDEDSKPRKRRRRTQLGLYDHIDYHNSYHRRSLRNIERRRSHPFDKPSSKRHGIRFQAFGSSVIRRSDRQPKKVFETFNESEIQRSIERRHQEMLELEQASMYDAIKRRRGEVSDTQEEDDEEEDSEEGSEEEESEEEEVEEAERGYSLRKRKPKTDIYQAPPLRSGHRRSRELYVHSPIRKARASRRIPQHASSPHHSYKRRRRRRRGTSSTSSSDDEAAFDRRKSKSMAQGRLRCLPMNFKPDDIVGVLKNRERAGVGTSLADVDPMTIDSKIKFSEVGGLDHHIRSLKEMVVFPLLYPEVFQKFNIAPPRGVLFYGPPGTGKTLVARALANECSSEGKKVAFFMRKGADCLSKWVGESERQLRLLFDQAYSMRPSIIFFDEIDGIAPVRSTRQDQIHSSIVSTLLALMDGLDARGEIVVIGATNRLDAIDPALRRPGRFDREFLFTLPNKKAREKILSIHTSAWQPKLSRDFLAELSEKCVGYCGADLKALCTETALYALRRRYPQIYESSKKLVLDMNEIRVASIDFKNAMKIITPASHRSNTSPSRSLTEELKPLLRKYYEKGLELLSKIFPPGHQVKDDSAPNLMDCDDEDASSIFEKSHVKSRTTSYSKSPEKYMKPMHEVLDKTLSHRPRLLIHGENGNGQTSYIAPAFLFSMEHLTSHVLDLPALFGNSSRTPEEAVSQIFREARRTSPSIIYLPHIEVWWNSVPETTRATFMTLLHDLPSSMPVLFLATADVRWKELVECIQDLFSSNNNELLELENPSLSDRYSYFKNLFLVHALKQPETMEKRQTRSSGLIEVLPEAAPPKPRELSAEESGKLIEYEESILRELRLHLRQATWKLLADRKFKEFSKPVDLDEVDDYLQVIKQPMDLSTMMSRINSHYYQSCAHFLLDINLITNNCLEYNPDKDHFDKLLRNRACELRDVAHALVHNDLDEDFEKTCIEICESRKKRGYDEKKNAPSFLSVIPKSRATPAANQSTNDITATLYDSTKPVANIPDPTGTRFSRRVRGLSEPSEFVGGTLEEVLDRNRVTKKATKPDENTDSHQDETLDASDCLNDTDMGMSDKNVEPAPQATDNVVSKNIVEKPIENIECANNTGENVQLKRDLPHEQLKDVEQVRRSLDFPDENMTEGTSLVEDAEDLLSLLVKKTDRCSVQNLERIYAKLCRCLSERKLEQNRCLVLKELKQLVDDIRTLN